MELVQVILSRRTVVLQHDESDCAAACLASICKYYGKRIPISTIRRLAGTDRKGTSGCGIMRGAKELGFPVKVRLVLTKKWAQTLCILLLHT